MSRSGIATASILVWALGTLGAEGVAQAGAVAVLVFALVVRRRIQLASDLRPFMALTLALACWQAFSPLIALAAGTAAHLPRAARWTQVLDTVAPASLAAVSTFGVPWVGLVWILGVGWAFETAMGVYQHLVRWPLDRLGPFKFPLNRLHQTFNVGGPERHPALGFFFHRLRFAHGAVALLGPAIAFALEKGSRYRRVVAAAAAVALLGCSALSYARAALFAALIVALAGLAALFSGRQRAWAGAFGLLTCVSLAVSPTWRDRMEGIRNTLHRDGERTVAMGTGWKLVRQRPVLGWGFGNYEKAALPYHTPEWSPVIWTSAHNVALTVWAETGIVGLALFAAQQLLLARALLKRARAGSVVAAGALLSLLGFHVIGLGHYVPFHSGVQLTFALVWGLGLAPNAPCLHGDNEVESAPS